jgi:hypothetical protein
MGIGRKPKNVRVFDVLSPEELIQKPSSDRIQYVKGIRNYEKVS